MTPRVIVITGASSGIGAAFARHYAAPDRTLVLVARRRPELEALARSLPGRHAIHALDVTDLDAMRAMARAVQSESGTPDLVIANAGVSSGTLGASGDDLEKLRRVLDINVVGLAATLGLFAPAMREAGRGTLCGIASVAGLRGLPGGSAYSASKAAAISLLESLRVEMHGTGVRVVSILPGYVDTPLTRVNRYRMPFLMDADTAVRRFARAIAAGRRRAIIPWPMAFASIALRLAPGWIYDRLASRAPRKARDAPL